MSKQTRKIKTSGGAINADLIHKARTLHQNDDVEIDDVAAVSVVEGEGAWVQAWVWVSDSDIEGV